MKFGEKGRSIRLGIIGLGGRGLGQTYTLLDMPDVEIGAVCDVYPDRVAEGIEAVKKLRGAACFGTLDYHEVNRMDDLDAVVIMTDWASHIRIAIDAMRCGRHVAMEVAPASSVQECWDLVHAAEDAGRICMFLENSCYDDNILTLLNMVRKNLFGELIFCEGGYQHDLREEIGRGDVNRHYRQDHFLRRNGEIYPTHELGPLAKLLRINRGNRMVSLTSMSSKAAGLHEWFVKNRQDRPDLCSWNVTQGDITSTVIRCAGGQLIRLTHDCTLPRPYAQDFRVQGTHGLWQESRSALYIQSDTYMEEGYEEWTPQEKVFPEHRHPMWKAYEKFGMRGDHDGLDYLTLRSFVEVVQNGANPPIDVYDAAAWMVIGCLSEESIAKGGAPVNIPDFTNGRWLTRGPEDKAWYATDEVYPEEFEDLTEDR